VCSSSYESFVGSFAYVRPSSELSYIHKLSSQMHTATRPWKAQHNTLKCNATQRNTRLDHIHVHMLMSLHLHVQRHDGSIVHPYTTTNTCNGGDVDRFNTATAVPSLENNSRIHLVSTVSCLSIALNARSTILFTVPSVSRARPHCKLIVPHIWLELSSSGAR